MPDWLIQLLPQFPMVAVIVGVIGVTIWYAEKRVREKELRLESRFDTQLAEMYKRADDREEKVRAREEQFRREAREDRNAEIARHL